MSYEKFLQYSRQLIIDFLVESKIVSDPEDIEVSVINDGEQTYNKQKTAVFKREGCKSYIFEITHDAENNQYILVSYILQSIGTYEVEEVEVEK